MLGLRFVLTLVAAVGLTASAFAQVNTSTLVGQVKDSSEAVLPGVTVTATELSTGRSFSGVTDERGNYRLASMPPGAYGLLAELGGFATVRMERVELLVGQTVNVPFVLRVAAVEETLTVTGESPLVDVLSNQVAGNVDRRQMEGLPLQGRNWLELAIIVKGITANSVGSNPGVPSDDMFQLNLDGQQVTQKVSVSSVFGQPKFSREAIAEFQLVTNLFDITQGRSTGVQVQAITRSGTNTPSGAVFGFFRSDRFNAADHIAKRVLPYSNQQTGGVFGGPIVRDKMHYFGSFEYERQPDTIISLPTRLPSQIFTFPSKSTEKNYLGRFDYAVSKADFVSVRGTRWDWGNPFTEVGSTTHPSQASIRTRESTNLIGTWSRVLAGGNKLSELRIAYNGYSWSNDVLPEFRDTPVYVFPGLTIGPRYNYPQTFAQDNYQARYDLTWHREKHDFKIGAEYYKVHDTGQWFILQRGQYRFHTRPPDLERRFPADAWNDPSRWDLTGLDPYVQFFDQNFHRSDWLIDIPRPTVAVWFGDTWRLNDRFTLNYGVRWDDDFRATDPPHVLENDIIINNGLETINAGFRNGIRDHNNVAPRVGLVYNVGGRGDLAIRGGTGLFYSVPVSNVTFSPQVYNHNQMIAASFVYDGTPGFVLDPRRGYSPQDFLDGRAPLPPQSPRTIDPEYAMPYTWQSSVGFQKQIGPTMSVESDLTHWIWYNDTRTRSLNLLYDPATGYNVNPLVARPDMTYNEVIYFQSDGRRDYLALSSALHRRFHSKFQGGVTYTLMFRYNDDTGSIGWTEGSADNQFDHLRAEWARSTSFQRHTLRAHWMYQLPAGFSVSGLYLFGSGNPTSTRIATQPYGKPGVNRLNLGPPIVIPEAMRERFDGPDVIGTGEVVPRNAFDGLPLHKMDVRITKDFGFGGNRKLSLTAEVFNVFNRGNFTGFQNQVDSVNFGLATSAQVPRSGQLGFRFAF